MQAATFGCVAIQGFLRKVFPHCNEAPHEPTGRLCVAVIFYTIASSDFSVMFVTFIIADTVDYLPEMR